jgi:hypothetical protein
MSQAEAVVARKAAEATEADATQRTAEDKATKEATEAEAAKGATEAEGATVSKGFEANSPDVVPRGAMAPRGSGAASTASHRERRTKLAADPAWAGDPLAPEVGTASTEAAMHGPRPEDEEELRQPTRCRWRP